MTRANIPNELLMQLQRERSLIANELPELTERHERMVEAKGEDTFSGHLRRAIHRQRRIARRVGNLSLQRGSVLQDQDRIHG
jgi:hypothetical protein